MQWLVQWLTRCPHGAASPSRSRLLRRPGCRPPRGFPRTATECFTFRVSPWTAARRWPDSPVFGHPAPGDPEFRPGRGPRHRGQLQADRFGVDPRFTGGVPSTPNRRVADTPAPLAHSGPVGNDPATAQPAPSAEPPPRRAARPATAQPTGPKRACPPGRSHLPPRRPAGVDQAGSTKPSHITSSYSLALRSASGRDRTWRAMSISSDSVCASLGAWVSSSASPVTRS